MWRRSSSVVFSSVRIASSVILLKKLILYHRYIFNNERVRLATLTLSVLNNKEARVKINIRFFKDSFLLIYFHSRIHLKFYKNY